MYKIKIVCIFTALVIATLLVSAACTPQAGAPTGERIVLKQNCLSPKGHIYERQVEYYAELVREATDGGVLIEIYPSSGLVPAKEELTATRDGIIDMNMLVMTYIAGALPLVDAFNIPFWSSFESQADVCLESTPVVNRQFMKSYNQRLLWHLMVCPYVIYAREKPITSLDELKGLKVRSSGGYQDKIVQMIGGIPVTTAAPEVYQALQRGIVDAGIITAPSYYGHRIFEVAPYVTLPDLMLTSGGSTINLDKWNSMPDGYQQAMLQAAEPAMRWSLEDAKKEMGELMEKYQQLPGVEVTVFGDAEKSKVKELSNPLWEEYLQKSGTDGQDLYDIFKMYW